MESPKSKLTKKIYDVSEKSYVISNTLPTALQAHKYYLRALGFEEIGNKYRMESAYHDFYMINYTVEGEAQMVFNNATYHLQKGDLVLVHRYSHFILTPLNKNNYDWKIIFMHINGEDIKDIFNEIRQKDIVILHDFPMAKLAAPFERMCDELRNPSEGQENRISGHIYSFLLDLRDFALKGEKDVCPPLKHILDYIRDNYTSPITLDDIAKFSYVSKSHINSLFIQYLGVTPIQYVMSLRIQKAQEMLCTTDLTIKKIAVLCGFKDDRSMIYVFKTHCDITPQQLRSSAKRPLTVPSTD